MDRQRRLMRTPLFFRRLGLVSIGYSVGKERIGAYRGGAVLLYGPIQTSEKVSK